MVHLRKSIPHSAARWGALFSFLLAVVGLSAVPRSYAQLDATPTPAVTLLPTVIAPALQFTEATRVIFTDLPYGREFGFHSIAVDNDENIYVPHADREIIVFSSEFEELRRFDVPNPAALAFTLNRDQLLIGRRFPAIIERYDLAGNPVGILWQTENAQLNVIAVDQQNSVYVIYTSLNTPFPMFLTRLDPNGNILFHRVLRDYTMPTDSAYGIAFEPNGALNIGISGFGVEPPEFIRLWRLSADGDRLTDQQRVFYFSFPLTSPALPIRLDDGSLVMLVAEGLGWWRADATLIDFYVGTEMFGGVYPRGLGRSGGLALAPDGETLYFATIMSEDFLVLGKTRAVR